MSEQKGEHVKLFVVIAVEGGEMKTQLITADGYEVRRAQRDGRSVPPGIHWNKRTRAYPTPAGARMYRNRLRSQGREACAYEVRIWDNGYVSGEVFE